MLTRRRLIGTLVLILSGSISVHAGQSKQRAPQPTTVTLKIDGMT